ncbi:MAG: Wzz/FepE/Etk N-terminal domain-containing protein [Paracoccaceae bacterium]
MSEAQGIGIADLVSVAKRRLWIVVLASLLLTPIAVGVAYILPPVYSASARILIESQQISDELARSTVTASAAERLELIKQRLLTRQNLIAIIEKLSLYSDFDEMTLADKIERLREATSFESTSFDASSYRRGPPVVSAFTITVEAHQPVLTSQAANEFVTMVLDLNIRQRSERASETVAFFSQQVERLSASILATERDIVAFKNENSDNLPESLSFRRDELSALDEKAYTLDQRRIELDEQRRELQLELEQGPAAPPISQLSQAEQQIVALRNTLSQQRSLLSDAHPQIRALEARIEALEKERMQASAATGEVADPAEAQTRRLKRRLELVENQISLLDERKKEAEASSAKLRESIDKTPQAEIALSSLQRRMSALQDQQERATSKLAEASTGERLEVNRQAERFVVIEQAQIPSTPKAPNRILIAGAGAAASIAVGLGLVVLLELLNNSIRSASDLQRRVNLRPIVVVPYIKTRREVLNRRLWMIVVAALLFVGVPGLLLLIDQYYLPLEILAERVFEKTGLDQVIQMIERRF